MRILWVCDVVLNDFTEKFGIKKTVVAGWMEGALYALQRFSDVHIGLCFPIIDEWRRHHSVYNGYRYYSFSATYEFGMKYERRIVDEFMDILEDFSPDVIHLWGTEYFHARALMEACLLLGMDNRLLVHIQGLVGIYGMHYDLGIPMKYLCNTPGNQIRREKESFLKQGKSEKVILSKSKYVMGRTEWDEACSKWINPNVNYLHCEEALRDEFYIAAKWDVHRCRRHSIFVSQASYPIKGIHFLLSALPMILSQYPDTELYIAGRPPLHGNSKEILLYGDYICDLIREHSLEQHVHFLGSLSAGEMVNQFHSANVFVVPSTVENSSNSICEAMLLGVPIVASYTGGTPSLITHGIDGLLYPCDAIYMLAANINRIFSCDGLAQNLSKNAIKRGEKRNNPNMIADRLRNIYCNISKSV